MAKKLKTFIVICSALILLGTLILPLTSFALCTDNSACGSGNDTASAACPSGQATSSDTKLCAPLKKASDCSVGVDPKDPTKCAPLGNGCKSSSAQDCLANDPIVKDLNIVVNFLSAAVGIIVIGVIILGGIQYSLAGDNSTATGAAKKRIINGLIALVAFIFTFAFLQWLIPGGI